MKIKKLFAILLTLALFTAGHAQTLDKAKLDQFFDRLAEKRQRRQRALHPRHRLQPDQRNRKETFDRGEQISDRFDHKNVHRRYDLTARRGRKIEADRHPRQILPANPERQ